MAWGLLVIAATVWGGMFAVAKDVLPSVDPYTITSIRYGLGALIFLVVLAVLEGRVAFNMEGRVWRLWIYGTTGFAGFNMLAYSGLAYTRPEHAAVITATMPMITVLINWLRHGQRPAVFTLITVVVAFIGVFLVVTNGHIEQAFRHGEVTGDLMVLSAAVCWVVYTLGGGDFPSWSALRYTVLSCALGTLSTLTITAGLAMFGEIRLPSIETITGFGWEFAYLVVLGAVVAVLSWNSGIRRVGAINGVLFINLVPVTAFVIGIVQGHDFGRDELLGAVLVVSALIANNLYSRRMLALVTPDMTTREAYEEA